MVEPAKKLFSDYLKKVDFDPPKTDVFSNTYAARYSESPEEIKECLSEHMIKPVQFVSEIEEMYKNGAGIFIEVGPGSVLTNLTKKILKDRPFIAVPTDIAGQEGLPQLLRAFGQLLVNGIPLSLDRLFDGRMIKSLNLDEPGHEKAEALSAATWLVNGSMARPVSQDPRKKALNANKRTSEEMNGAKTSGLPLESNTGKAYTAKKKHDMGLSETFSVKSGNGMNSVDATMMRYQKLMNKFMETQKNIMLSYLQSRSRSSNQLVTHEPGLSQTKIKKQSVEKVSPHEYETVPRFLIKSYKTALPEEMLKLSGDGVFIVTDDGRGIASSLAKRLIELGGQAVILRLNSERPETEDMAFSVCLDDPSELERVISEIEQKYRSIVGVIHLQPLAYTTPFQKMDFHSWKEHLKRDVKYLFYLAKAAGSRLRGAGIRGDAWLVAATALYGQVNNGNSEKGGFVGQAGIAGLMKTLSLEWPEVNCKAIDLDMANEPELLITQLLKEMTVKQGPVELGYRGAERIVSRAEPASLNQKNREIRIESDWVILVTGGAAGITAQVAYELAVKYKPILILVGRSPHPDEGELSDTVGLTMQKDIKAALIKRFSSNGQSCTPVTVEKAYSGIIRGREIRRNIKEMRDAGATVHYFQANVCDEQKFGGLIDKVYSTFKRIDGVIHGAGIIEDKLLEDKSYDSFNRVFDTKTDSAFIIARKIHLDSLKFIAFFTSVAGFFGNRGQSDYAAANEVLNELALFIDGKTPGRVVSINWGPWKKKGMVTPELEKKFKRLGIQLIPTSVGPSMFEREIRCGGKGKVEVVIGDGPWMT
jgi:NAD(P)-dependent dehydrogenase (short-subunit alcohol dehydrogenase family)